jgi:hypothetical protein
MSSHVEPTDIGIETNKTVDRPKMHGLAWHKIMSKSIVSCGSVRPCQFDKALFAKSIASADV